MRQRHEVVQIDAVTDAPGKMLGDHCRLEAVAHRLEAREMGGIDALRRTQRQTNAMEFCASISKRTCRILNETTSNLTCS